MTAPLAAPSARARSGSQSTARPGVPSGGDWSAANQAWLTAAVAVVARRLARHAGVEESTWAAPEPAWPDPALPLPALETLCLTFRLSGFEREVLLACAGVELEASFAGLCAAANGLGADAAPRAHPTFSLALAALAEPHWSALGPDAPLRRWHLVELLPGTPLTLAPLRIDEWVLHFLAGVRQPDERLAGLLTPAEPVELLSVPQRELARRIVAVWTDATPGAKLPLVQLVGPDPADRLRIAASACRQLGWQLTVLRADAIPPGHAEIRGLARLCEREMALTAAALLIDCEGLDAGEANLRAALRLLATISGPVLLADNDPHPTAGRTTMICDVPAPTAADRRAAWQEALAAPGLGAELDPRVHDRLVWTFGLGVGAIEGCAAEIRARAVTVPPSASGHLGPLAWSVCRTRARAPLEGLAARVEPSAGWDDLVLPAAQSALLHQVLVQVRNRATVYGTWGFGARMSATLGITALFHGPSGTGKSMAAEVLAAELELDLFRVDLSLMVSKYIGETEKNLRRIFEAAEASGAVLVFDEADALFGTRSEVKDSHDRYANIQVSYLLQRMETYRGLAVLTTNLKASMDTAFLRRLRFIVQFPFPDAAQRAEIWRRAFPPDLPAAGLDVTKLARLDVAGGNIRNIALGAAFLAADAAEPLRMAHLAQAARAEYAKLERPFNEAEVTGWA
jgi:hypothetical protein